MRVTFDIPDEHLKRIRALSRTKRRALERLLGQEILVRALHAPKGEEAQGPEAPVAPVPEQEVIQPS